MFEYGLGWADTCMEPSCSVVSKVFPKVGHLVAAPFRIEDIAFEMVGLRWCWHDTEQELGECCERNKH